MNRPFPTRWQPWVRLGLPGLLAATLLAACAVPAAKPADATTAAVSARPEDCIFASVITDWADLDKERLILYGPGTGQPYLAQLEFPSNELPFNMRIGVLDSDHNGMICGNGFDSILIPGGLPDRIRIISLHKLSREEAKQMLAAAHPKKDAKPGKVVPPTAGDKPAT